MTYSPSLGDRKFEIEITDTIFVRVRQLNNTILECSLSGFSSIADLLRAIGQNLGNISGMVSVNLRNRNRGQSTHRAVRFAGSTSIMPVTHQHKSWEGI